MMKHLWDNREAEQICSHANADPNPSSNCGFKKSSLRVPLL